jgi:acyl-CoA thioester hydrolase
MNIFFEGPVLWSQIDANMHLRHSAYADFAAQARLNMLEQVGIKAVHFMQHQLGPILFREELIYHREIGANENVKVSCEMTKCKADGSRWSIKHEIFRGDGIKSATVNVDGAWIDFNKRKLTGLPAEMLEKFKGVPRSVDFIEEP